MLIKDISDTESQIYIFIRPQGNATLIEETAFCYFQKNQQFSKPIFSL